MTTTEASDDDDDSTMTVLLLQLLILLNVSTRSTVLVRPSLRGCCAVLRFFATSV
jgi:hypothetical protein